MFKKPEKQPQEDIDDDINVEEIVKIIAPERITGDDVLKREMKVEASGKREPTKAVDPAKIGNPTPTGNPGSDRNKTTRAEEESIEKLVTKIDEVHQNLDDLSKGIIDVNKDLRSRMDMLTNEMNRLTNSLKDAAQAVEQARSNIQSSTPSSQAGQRLEQPPYAPPPTQQPAPQQGYQPQSYGYRAPPPSQQQYPQRPPQQQPPQQGYYQQPPPQQGYYSQQPPPQQGFFQPQQPPPPPPGASPEEAVSKGAESLRGTVFDDVVSAFGQVASIVFSRLIDAREKILRIDPSFPVQEFEPVLSELRANPRMKLSQVDKRKLIDRMLFWASRLPRSP